MHKHTHTCLCFYTERKAGKYCTFDKTNKTHRVYPIVILPSPYLKKIPTRSCQIMHHLICNKQFQHIYIHSSLSKNKYCEGMLYYIATYKLCSACTNFKSLVVVVLLYSRWVIDVLFWRILAGNVIVLDCYGAEHKFHAILRYWLGEQRLVVWVQCDQPVFEDMLHT